MSRIPHWLKISIPGGGEYSRVKKALEGKGLHTVCADAKCPNIGECFCAGRATFLIMGGVCTRNCLYCAVASGIPDPLDPDEPRKIACAIREMNLKYAVLTSVTRDDLPDGGASHFAACVKAIRRELPECGIEILIPDFMHAHANALQIIAESGADCINHNIEVVEIFFEKLRPEGNYRHSLKLLQSLASGGVRVKSGLMVGFGESREDITQTLYDLKRAGCSIVTVGQYLQSKKNGFPVTRYYHPDEFKEIAAEARSIGFDSALCGPLVRSSYHAEESFHNVEG